MTLTLRAYYTFDLKTDSMLFFYFPLFPLIGLIKFSLFLLFSYTALEVLHSFALYVYSVFCFSGYQHTNI